VPWPSEAARADGPSDSSVPDADAKPSPDVPQSTPTDAWSCNLPSRVDDAGVTQWSWRLQWWGADGDLADVCASYGAGAKMVMEVGFPQNPHPTSTLPECTTDEVLNGATRACILAGSFRFEADCTAQELVFELPSENTFHGYFHIEGPAVGKTMRYLLGQNVACSRQVFTRTGVSFAPETDGGVNAQGPVDACDILYPEPGCGVGAKPVCYRSDEPVPLLGALYCGCDGATLMGSVVGPSEPYQFKGACPGDGGLPPNDGGACSFEGGGLPESYDACVAAGGKAVNATSLVPAMCVFDIQGQYGNPVDYGRCTAVGGYTTIYDLVCQDAGMKGSKVCMVFYPQNGCPTVTRPEGYFWQMPSCSDLP
jgi:hypothetical protein